jgi:hypothetical protein
MNVFENISKNTKNYNEIKEYYRFLKLWQKEKNLPITKK